MKSVKTTWYLYAEDSHSNEVISRALLESQTIDMFKMHRCADEKDRYLYETPSHAFAEKMCRSQVDLHAKMKIFRSENGGIPAEVNFDIFKKSKKTSALHSIKKAGLAIKLGAMMPKHRKH